MSRTYRNPPTYDNTKKRPNDYLGYRSYSNSLHKTFVERLKNIDDESEDPEAKNTSRKSRKKLKQNTSENKKSYSLLELTVMEDFQSIIGSSKNITEIKEKLSSFLHKRYSKYITHITLGQRRKRAKIYQLIKLLRKENIRIFSTELDFLKSLVKESIAEKNDLEK